jgi:mycofactocin glycosyltransferase
VTPLPEGFGLVLDRSVRAFRNGTVLVGGHPGRLIALSPAGTDALSRWLEGGPATAATRRLGRRLVDAGMAHPVAPVPVAVDRPEVTVVVPVRDRPGSLDRCLGSVGGGVPVVVVDDGSMDPEAIAAVCRRHGARRIHRAVNGGPGAARNQAMAVVTTDLVAFVDSDCEVGLGWLDALVAPFGDPELVAVAPRIRARPVPPTVRRTTLDRYTEGRSALDMGGEPSQVGPGRVVAYVPSAVLVVRVAGLLTGFDEELRVGEDVDLVWRLLDDGWRVRYEPSVVVHHDEPNSWARLLGRRWRYGTSAGPLARRHPGRLAPLELRPWPTGVAAALVSGHPGAALALLSGATGAMAPPLRRHGVPLSMALRWSALGAGWTVVGAGRALTMLVAPVVAIGVGRRWRWAGTAALLMTVPPLVDWWRMRPPLDPVRWSVASIADDVAYGTGVWMGCVRARSIGPLLPAVRLRRARPEAGIRAGDLATGGKGVPPITAREM